MIIVYRITTGKFSAKVEGGADLDKFVTELYKLNGNLENYVIAIDKVKVTQ